MYKFLIKHFNYLGYPQEEAAIVALRTIRGFLEHDHNLVNF